LEHLRKKVSRSLEVDKPDRFAEGGISSRRYRLVAAKDRPTRCHHTSPPFFASTRFYLANWMRLWFCGWEVAISSHRPLAFMDERQKHGFEIYATIFAKRVKDCARTE